MKTKLIKSLMAPLVVAFGLVSMAAAGTPPKGSTEAGTGGRLQEQAEGFRELGTCR